MSTQPDLPLPKAVSATLFQQRTAEWPEEWRTRTRLILEGLAILERAARRALFLPWFILGLIVALDGAQALSQHWPLQQLASVLVRDMVVTIPLAALLFAVEWFIFTRTTRRQVIHNIADIQQSFRRVENWRDGYFDEARGEFNQAAIDAAEAKIAAWGDVPYQLPALRKAFPEIAPLIKHYLKS